MNKFITTLYFLFLQIIEGDGLFCYSCVGTANNCKYPVKVDYCLSDDQVCYTEQRFNKSMVTNNEPLFIQRKCEKPAEGICEMKDGTFSRTCLPTTGQQEVCYSCCNTDRCNMDKTSSAVFNKSSLFLLLCTFTLYLHV